MNSKDVTITVNVSKRDVQMVSNLLSIKKPINSKTRISKDI